ncbi:HAD family hydrolase [Haliangium sp.]|uniref:HAD family hydrolase n=1 Tax=Haliangium sp. TaxID=2663208 RepID=UPI003D0D7AC2
MIPAAYLFDLDGTLADTLADLAIITNWALARHGLPTHPVEVYRAMVGSGAQNWVAALAPDAGPALVQTLIAELLERRRTHPPGHTRLYDGVPALLDTLSESGARMAVLSNKDHRAAVAMCADLLGRWSFEAVYGARPEVPLKPDPAAAVAIAAELGVAPGDVAYLGDTGIDMHTANRAGMVAVGALWGFRDAAELEGAGARVLIAHPSELPAALARL